MIFSFPTLFTKTKYFLFLLPNTQYSIQNYMQIAIDIGNSNVVIGIYDEKEWKHVWRIPTIMEGEALYFYERQLTNHLMETDIHPEQISQIIFSSVVPDLNETFMRLAKPIFGQEMVVVGPDIYPKVDLLIDRPDELGTDLFSNAIAAKDLYKKDVIVVDFGTALTFTTVTAKGHILGVAIAPGLKTAINALYQNTAQLPDVPLELPATPVGKNSAHAIQSGVLIGYVGLVKHMLEAIREEVGPQYIAIATGGLSSILHPLKDTFDVINRNLTLEGLRIIGDYVKE